MKKWTLMIGIVIGAMVVGLAAFASAPISALAQGEAAPAVASSLVGRLQGIFSPDSHGRGPDSSRGGGGAEGLVSATASVTGLTQQEVMTQLQAGQSLAQIATDNGKTADDVIAAARTELSTRLAQDVTDGRLTQAQADARLADFDANAPTLVNSTTLGTEHGFGPGFDGGRHGGPRGNGPEAFISATAIVTGLTAQDVMTQLQSGQSLAQIAQDNGKTADDVIAAARAELSTKLSAAVTAGSLTQAQADAKLAAFDANAATIVNDTNFGAFGPHGHGHGPDDGTAAPAPTGVTF